MRKRIKCIVIFILVLTIIISGVLYIYRTSIVAHFVPTVEQFGDIQIQIKNDTALISSQLIVQNKSFLKIKIDSIKYKVSLFNKTYLQNQKFIGIILLGHGKDTIGFSLKVPYFKFLKDIRAERKKTDSAYYSIDISLQYATALGKINIPFNKSAKIKIPQPPEFKVLEIKYKKIRLKSIQAVATIKIINHSAVALTIKDLNYTINILNRGSLKGKHIESICIKPNGTSIIKLPIVININNIGKTIFEVIMNKDNYDYTLNLDAFLKSSPPMKESFLIDISYSGKMELIK